MTRIGKYTFLIGKMYHSFILPKCFLDAVREEYPEEQAQELIKWLTEDPINTPDKLFQIHEDVPNKEKRIELYNVYCEKLDWFFEELEFLAKP